MDDLTREKKIAQDAANAANFTTSADGLAEGMTVYRPSSGSTSSGTGSSGSGSYDKSSYLKQIYAAQTEAALSNLKSAYETAMQDYDAAKEKLPGVYQEAKNTAAATNALEKRAFDERAAASGLNSGTGGQAQLAMSGALQGQLGKLDREQAQAESDIELERAKTQAEYQAAIAQAKAEGDNALASALYQEMVRVQGLEREDQQLADANAREDEQLAKKWKREDEQLAEEYRREDEAAAKKESSAEAEYAREIALSYGLIDPALIGQINSLADLAKLSAGTASAAGTGTDTGNTGSLVAYDNGGLTEAQVKQMQAYYGVTADGKWGPNSKKAAGGLSAKDAWAAYQNGQTGSGDGLLITAALGLGLGPVANAALLTELADCGAITEDSNGVLHWTTGWSADNYSTRLMAARARSAILAKGLSESGLPYTS